MDRKDLTGLKAPRDREETKVFKVIVAFQDIPTGDKGIKGPNGDNGTTGPAGNPGEEGTRGIGNFCWCEQTFVQQTTGNIRRSDTQVTKDVYYKVKC